MGSRTTMPRRAASDTPPMIATGIARISGQGVATTKTESARVAEPETMYAMAATSRASGV
jgi:hypothetical protein